MSTLYSFFTDPIVISGIVTPIIGGFGWFFRHFYTVIKDRVIKQKKEDYIRRLRSIASIYAAMDRLRASDEVTRVLLLEIGNGGHKPLPGSIMYGRAIEVMIDEIGRKAEILQSYREIKLDESYIRMVIQVQQTNQGYKFNVKEHEYCLLKDIYVTEGIKYSEIYHIYTDLKAEKTFILSIATDSDIEQFRKESTRGFINTEVMQIRSYFEEFRKE